MKLERAKIGNGAIVLISNSNYQSSMLLLKTRAKNKSDNYSIKDVPPNSLKSYGREWRVPVYYHPKIAPKKVVNIAALNSNITIRTVKVIQITLKKRLPDFLFSLL